jgi:peptidoglycan/LPS O-acetylase OafA/YrhL
MEYQIESQTIVRPAYYSSLDGYRAIAVLLVFFHHYAGTKFFLFEWGWVGVDFFFVLSGFLITGILFDTRNKFHRYRNFYIRRTLRIFPLYYFVWAVLLVMAPLVAWQWNWHWSLWPAYLGNYARFLLRDISFNPYRLDVLTAGPAVRAHFTMPMHAYIGHFWSLCIEEQFYLFWPLVIYTVRRRETLIRICIAIILLEPLFRLLLTRVLSQHLLQMEILYRSLPTRLDALLIGGLLALLMRSPMHQSLSRYRHYLLAASIALLTIYLATCKVLYGPSSSASSTPISTLGFTLIDLLGASVILQAIQPVSVIAKVLNFKPLRALGVISYGFYVYHDLPHDLYFYAAARFTPRDASWMTTLFGFAGTLALSILSYRLLESPILRLKDRFTSSKRLEQKRLEDVETLQMT